MHILKISHAIKKHMYTNLINPLYPISSLKCKYGLLEEEGGCWKFISQTKKSLKIFFFFLNLLFEHFVRCYGVVRLRTFQKIIVFHINKTNEKCSWSMSYTFITNSYTVKKFKLTTSINWYELQINTWSVQKVSNHFECQNHTAM